MGAKDLGRFMENQLVPTMADPLAGNVLGISPLGRAQQIAGYKFASRYVPADGVVADIGCASGFGSKVLRGYSQYIGVDLPQTIERIRSQNRYVNERTRFVATDLNKEELDLGTLVDTVIAIDVIEHIFDPNQFLSQLYKLLKPGGNLVLSTPNNPHGEEPVSNAHFREYSLKEITDALDETGFSLQRVYTTGAPFGLLIRAIERIGIKVRRSDALNEERSIISKFSDHAPFIKGLYTAIRPYGILGSTGTNMILVAEKHR